MLYDRYAGRLYAYACVLASSQTEAEDILQDCFLRLHKYAHSIDSSLPLRPWLYRVTTNLAYNWEKRRKRWQTPLDGVLDWLASPTYCSPERRAEMSDVQSKVMDAIYSLNTSQRIVIVLFYLNSLNVNEIASILNCPIGTVKSRLHYGRENVRRRLGVKRKIALEMAYEFI